jgi:hypothetical protein
VLLLLQRPETLQALFGLLLAGGLFLGLSSLQAFLISSRLFKNPRVLW